MALAEFVAQLEAFQAAALSAFASAADASALEAARIEFLGAKSGQLKTVQKQLGSVAGPDKPTAGKRFNEAKTAVEAAFAAAEARLAAGGASADRQPFDLTLPGRPVRLGHLHPLTQTIEELKDIMGRLGFTVAHGPEIEDEWHNFEALNIPASHPARDPLENFYLSTAHLVAGGAPLLLRSQTSTVQIRVMEAAAAKARADGGSGGLPGPIRIIAPGRVYRPDTVDATHSFMFHQIEGLAIDRGTTMADLKTALLQFARAYFGPDAQVRLRPSFFPFTEPSAELDMMIRLKPDEEPRWIELGGCGMVDPAVFQACGIDPEIWTGFAFGFGIERIAMGKYGIPDIRMLFDNDVRFLQQL